ncbi:MAG: hypothetical protein JWN80_1648 [Microbacteriaceae bacterium]|nr:hypothetical protein [Microbacteriaceae bacterium]
MSALALWERPVSYGAVGATQAPDLMTYPPAGYRPFSERTRIGHGDARWRYACTEILTWGIQRRAGFKVELTESPTEVSELTYMPVSFDETGEPITPSSIDTDGEHTFGPDGVAFVAPGDTALLGVPFGPFRVKAPARVVYVIDEPNRKGFAYGTLRGHPEDGEESFVVDRTEDGSVWLEIRAFSRPASRFWWVVYPVLRVSQAFYTRRYFATLSGQLS